jgi:MoxR-like ATPase
MKNKVNVLIEGDAGSGKTICVQSYASARGYRYFNVSNNNSTEPSELFGQWIPTPEGKYKWQDGAVTQLVRNGGVLLLNEVRFLPERVSTVLFSLLDYRREIQLMGNGGEVIKAHPDLLIVADMNYVNYRGGRELNQAFNDRFGIKLEFPYDKNIEKKLIKYDSVLMLTAQLRAQYEKEELSNPISTRGLVDFVNNAQRFGLDFAISSFVNGFNKEERGGVRLACETHKENIAIDMGASLTYKHDEYRVESGF